MTQILALFDELFKPQPILATLANLFPWLQVLPPMKKAQDKVFGRIDKVYEFVKERISDREENFDADVIRDFVDLYHAKRQDDTHNLCEKNLICMIMDLFGAGSETTSTSLTWHVLYMLHNPDVMTKCQGEIDTVVGRGRPVKLADKANLPYVEATIMEVLRLSNIALLTLPHALNNGGEFRGYKFPPRTLVVANLKSVHVQQDKWDQPDLFNPQRFLLDDGTVNRKLPLVAFGMGPRMCAGELLAKQELFLFFANLLQRFHFRPATSSQLPSLNGILGITNSPELFQVKLVAR
ncbi:cytochrome P450 2J4-like [Littorina saxatilis]|uniref:cytochrome P450 2J4-like n=1 Tax=Littorina saxatilis TaxID=31220 RepID=UPI0038B5B872